MPNDTLSLIKQYKLVSFIVFAAAIIVLALILVLLKLGITNNKVHNFKECVSAGHPTTKTEPRQCSTDTGLKFIERVKTDEVQF